MESDVAFKSSAKNDCVVPTLNSRSAPTVAEAEEQEKLESELVCVQVTVLPIKLAACAGADNGIADKVATAAKQISFFTSNPP